MNVDASRLPDFRHPVGLCALLSDPDPRIAEIAATSLLRLGPAGRSTLDSQPSNSSVDSARAVARLQGSLS